jgi:hypothetical protein
MAGLSAAAILTAWERASAGISPQALAILEVAFPERTRDELKALPLGARAALLLYVRMETFGREMDGFAECPSCGEAAQFTLDAQELAGSAPAPEPGEHSLDMGGKVAVYRLPTAADLDAVATEPDAEAAARRLAERCVIRLQLPGGPPLEDAADDDVLAAVADQIDRDDPLAGLDLDLACPACRDRWSVPFDAASFVFSEVRHRAHQLLLEVDALARAYGWGEDDILRMSDARRELYVGLVS